MGRPMAARAGGDCAGSAGGVVGGGADAGVSEIRVELPGHLRTLAGVTGEVRVEVDGAVTPRTVLDALEAMYPALRGTIREQGSGERRAFMRFFAEETDWSHEGMDAELPESVKEGREALLILGAISGG